MKRVCKGSPPQKLNDYVLINPEATWDQMKGDNAQGGSQAAKECRDQAIHDQKGLCAYCEQEISSSKPHRCRIEHFHPKIDKTRTHNWGLDWYNMLAACDGGSRSSQEEQRAHPLPGNLACDAHKDYLIQTGKIPVACEGYLLSPLVIHSFPNLFSLDKGTGYLKPDVASCINVEISENAFGSTTELIDHTIAILNLNCDRLAAKRRHYVVNIDQNKKTLRKKGIPPSDVPEKLVQRYFKKEWPEFFTTLRCCLGKVAEDYLKSVNYQG
ncbi:MAG: hypothetical protein FWG42_01595 [Clostridiales bacterium]|nr:hypothetical protein [Clostridiales bacterium]